MSDCAMCKHAEIDCEFAEYGGIICDFVVSCKLGMDMESEECECFNSLEDGNEN